MSLYSLLHLLFPLSLFFFGSSVFSSRNPVYGVLSFIIVVAHIVVLLIMLDLEFYAYILAIVYIGAIVVLFIFVIMMFQLRENNNDRPTFFSCLEYFILGSGSAYFLSFYAAPLTFSGYLDFSDTVLFVTTPHIIANVLFNEWSLITIAVTLIMFVGILGAITLTIKLPDYNMISSTKLRNTVKESIKKLN